ASILEPVRRVGLFIDAAAMFLPPFSAGARGGKPIVQRSPKQSAREGVPCNGNDHERRIRAIGTAADSLGKTERCGDAEGVHSWLRATRQNVRYRVSSSCYGQDRAGQSKIQRQGHAVRSRSAQRL